VACARLQRMMKYLKHLLHERYGDNSGKLQMLLSLCPWNTTTPPHSRLQPVQDKTSTSYLRRLRQQSKVRALPLAGTQAGGIQVEVGTKVCDLVQAPRLARESESGRNRRRRQVAQPTPAPLLVLASRRPWLPAVPPRGRARLRAPAAASPAPPPAAEVAAWRWPRSRPPVC
jgi:hypothetical protein